MEEPCLSNPKYNGHHTCPKCGGDSFWTCLSPDQAQIRVECQNGCGTYLQTHSELKSQAFYDRPVALYLK